MKKISRHILNLILIFTIWNISFILFWSALGLEIMLTLTQNENRISDYFALCCQNPMMILFSIMLLVVCVFIVALLNESKLWVRIFNHRIPNKEERVDETWEEYKFNKGN